MVASAEKFHSPPPFVVPSIAPSHRHTEPSPAIQNKSHPLSTCTTPWPVRFDATPFAPPGTKVIIHLKPTIRKSWAPRGQYGWYIYRAKDHYRCYNIYIPETRALIQPEKVEFLPHNSKMPFRSLAENATIAATELIHDLCNPTPAAPYAHICYAQMQALDQLAENFQHTTVQPEQQIPSETSTQSPGLPPRVAPKLPRLNIPPIIILSDKTIPPIV